MAPKHTCPLATAKHDPKFLRKFICRRCTKETLVGCYYSYNVQCKNVCVSSEKDVFLSVLLLHVMCIGTYRFFYISSRCTYV